MATGHFYPYRVSTKALALRLTERPQGTSIRPDGTVDAYSDDPQRVQLRMELAVDVGELISTLPESSRLEDIVNVLLVSRSIAGRDRRAIKLSSPFETKMYELILDRAEWAGEVDVLAIAVRNCPGEGGIGFASDRGAVLAESEPVRVQFGEPLVAPGSNMDVEWVDFREDPGLDDAHLYAIRPVPNMPPKILLNSSFNGAYPVLTSSGRRGAKYRIKQATFSQIVHQGWSSILSDLCNQLRTAILDATLDSEPPKVEETLSGLAQWQGDVLRDWASYLYPEAGDRETALESLIGAVSQAEWQDLLVVRMSRAIQTRFTTYKSFEGLVREAHLISREEG
jgi:hypothetical protein